MRLYVFIALFLWAPFVRAVEVSPWEAEFDCLVAEARLSGRPLAELEIRNITKTRQLLTEVYRGGGFTFSVRPSAGDLAGREFTAVSLYPDRTTSIQGRKLTRADVEAFLSKNADLLYQPNHNVGVWVDEKNGTTDLDVIVTVPSSTPEGKRLALELGKKYNQKAIFDLGAGKLIEIPGATGAAPEGVGSVYDRAKQVRAMIPTHIPWMNATFSMPAASGVLGRSKAAVPIYPERMRIVGAKHWTIKDLTAFSRENADLLAKPDHEVGVWEDNGSVRYDVVVTMPTRYRHERDLVTGLAWRYGQRLVFDSREIRLADVDQSPSPPPPLPPVKDRAADFQVYKQYTPALPH